MSDAAPLPPADALPALLQAIRARTPARILVGRAGPAYPTITQLELRRDHAAAIDAVHAELDLQKDFGAEFINRWGLFEVMTQARDKPEFLMRPDRGRRLTEPSQAAILQRCPREAD